MPPLRTDDRQRDVGTVKARDGQVFGHGRKHLSDTMGMSGRPAFPSTGCRSVAGGQGRRRLTGNAAPFLGQNTRGTNLRRGRL